MELTPASSFPSIDCTKASGPLAKARRLSASSAICWRMISSEITLQRLVREICGVCSRLRVSPSHADLFSVRGPYKKAPKVPVAKPVISDPGGLEENVAEQRA